MKKLLNRIILVYISLVVFGIAEEDAPIVPKKGQVKIGTWNMKWFPGGFPSGQSPKEEYRRFSSGLRFILWQKIDVLMMQEMRSYEVCSNLVAEMKIPGYQVNACTRFPTPEDAAVPTHQNAIISRYKAVDSGYEEWASNGNIKPPRGFAYAILDCEGVLCAFFSIHLKSNFIANDENSEKAAVFNRLMREESARQIVKKMKEISSKKYNGRSVETIVLGGDFNTSIFEKNFEEEKTIHIVMEAGYKDVMKDVPLDKRETMPPTKYHGSSVFDYIFIKGKGQICTPVVAPASWISDHRMVTAILDFSKK